MAGQAWVSGGMDDRSISHGVGFREGWWEEPSLQTRSDPVRVDPQHTRKPAQLNGSPRLPYYFRDSWGEWVMGGIYWSDPDRLPLYVWGFTSITRRLLFRPSDGSAQALDIGLAGAIGCAWGLLVCGDVAM